LPNPVPEESFHGDHFHIKPLLPLLEDAGSFWLLTISANHTRLYYGYRWEFSEDKGIDLPQGVGKIRGMTDYEETHYGSPVGRHGGLAKAQSFGDDPDQIRKEELLEFLHRVVPPVEPLIKRSPAPVIVAAPPELQGHFREIAGWREIQPDGITENPDALSEAELHRGAYALVEPKLAEARAAAVDRLNALLPAGKATTKPEEIVKAARYARVSEACVHRFRARGRSPRPGTTGRNDESLSSAMTDHPPHAAAMPRSSPMRSAALRPEPVSTATVV